MQISQVAAQLYTLRDFLKTPDEIHATLKKVRAIGYQAVQVSGMALIAEAELKAMLDGEGLVCCATHEATQTILEQPETVVERLQKLDCRFTAVPSPGAYDVSTLEAAKVFAAKMNAAGKVLAQNGQTLTYHNHHFEFVRFGDKTLLELFYDETEARNLQGEIDTYWVQYGGGSTLDWCRRLNNRLPLIHLKDYGIGAEQKPVFREIGNGNLNWKEILPAAEAAGCQWFIVEQDTCEGDPFEALQTSFEFLKHNFCD